MLLYFVICDVYYTEDDLTMKTLNFFFNLLEVESRSCDPRLRVSEKYLYNNINKYYSFDLIPHICKASCSSTNLLPDFNDLIDY